MYFHCEMCLSFGGGRAGRDLDVGRRVHHLAEVERPAGAGVMEPVILRVHLARIDAPLPGRRLLEHVPAPPPQLAHDVEMVAGAPRAVGVLAVLASRIVPGLVARGLPDIHPLPVGLQLVGEIIGMPVRTPWPISDRLQVMVTVPSLAIRTKRLG